MVLGFPPPPVGLLSEDSDDNDVTEDLSSPVNPKSLMGFVVRPPPMESYAREESGELTAAEDKVVSTPEPLVGGGLG